MDIPRIDSLSRSTAQCTSPAKGAYKLFNGTKIAFGKTAKENKKYGSLHLFSPKKIHLPDFSHTPCSQISVQRDSALSIHKRYNQCRHQKLSYPRKNCTQTFNYGYNCRCNSRSIILPYLTRFVDNGIYIRGIILFQHLWSVSTALTGPRIPLP